MIAPRFALFVLASASASACIHLPHIPPEARTREEQRLTVATIEMLCDEAELTWVQPKAFSGVIISERHILVVMHPEDHCPVIPRAHATFQTEGRERVLRMTVERDDYAFGSGLPIGRLEIASADRFHLNVAPPLLWSASFPGKPPEGVLCAHLPLHWPEVSCGTVDDVDYTLIRGMKTSKGDTGAPIYDPSGRLVGLVLMGNGISTKMILVDPKWLEGT